MVVTFQFNSVFTCETCSMSTYKRSCNNFKIYMYFISDNVRFSIENISIDNNPGEGSRKIRKLRRLFLSLISVSTRVAVERTPLKLLLVLWWYNLGFRLFLQKQAKFRLALSPVLRDFTDH